MRKVLFALFIITLSAGVAQAQQKKTRKVARLGLKSGLNLTHFHITGLDEGTISADWKTGFVFGAFVEMKISDKMYFQPEALYSSVGGKNVSPITGENSLRLNYLAVPVSLKYEFAPHFKLLGGIQLSWMLQATDIRYETKNDITSSLRNSDIALQGGVEYWPSRTVVIGARYMHGLSDIEYYTGTKAFNQGGQLTLGIKL